MCTDGSRRVDDGGLSLVVTLTRARSRVGVVTAKRGSWIRAAAGPTPVSVSPWRAERSNRGQEGAR